MSYTYTITVDDLEFEVSVTGDDEYADIDEILLNGESVDVQSLYVKDYKGSFIPLEQHLFYEVVERLCEDGGVRYQAECARADDMYSDRGLD